MMVLMSQLSRGIGSAFSQPASENLLALMLDGDHTYNASGSGVTVDLVDGEYRSSIAGGDASGSTWFESSEGRLDYLTMTGDFDVVAENVGLLSGATAEDYQFCGLICWLSANNYEFAVAGNRGSTTSTVEYKATVASASYQDDTGTDSITSHRCDFRVTRSGSTVTFYYRQVGQGDGDWITLPHSSLTARVSFGTGPLRVGIVTYGFSFVEAFTAGCDLIDVRSGSYA